MTVSAQGSLGRLETEFGSMYLLGQIVATTTKNNADTVAPFNATGDALKGKMLLVQASAACHILTGTVGTLEVTTDTGLELIAKEKRIIRMDPDSGWIAVVGAATLKVWELK